MKKLTICIAAIAAVMMMISFESCNSGGKTASAKTLKFNLEKGKGYDYDMVWDMDQKIMGQDMKMSFGANFTMNVTDDDGKVKTISSTYKSFKMYMKMPQAEIDVDTDKPADEAADATNPMAMVGKVFRAIKGKSFVIKVDNEGTVISVEGFEDIVNSMVESISMNEQMQEALRASLKDQFSGQSIKDQFGPVFNIFPNKEVKVGDSWDKSYSTGGKTPAKYTTTYTVKSIDGDNVSMTTKTKIESSGDADVSGTQEGNILVDSKTGLMINGEFDQKIKTTMQGTSIDINGKGKIKGKAI
jgi:hypothetical protein